MTTKDRVWTNARLVLADEIVHGTLAVQDGKIADISSGTVSHSAAVDLEGDLVLPGLVELHTDNVERHVQPRPNALWPVEAAVLNDDRELASVGITTVLNALCIGEVHSRTLRSGFIHEMVEAYDAHIASDALKIDHYFHWRCEVSYPALNELLDPLLDHPRVRLISVMDHSPGQRQFVDVNRYAEYYQGKFNMRDSELAEFIENRTRDSLENGPRNRAYVVAAAHKRDIPLASHDDATSAHVTEAIENRVVVAEFPTTIEAAKASHEAGLHVLMGGPNIVRGKSHSGNVSALDLAGLGLLDVISSDYVPASLLWAAMKLHNDIGISLPASIAKVTRNPARAVGLLDRGELNLGLRADFIRVKPTHNVPLIREVWREGERVA